MDGDVLDQKSQYNYQTVPRESDTDRRCFAILWEAQDRLDIRAGQIRHVVGPVEMLAYILPLWSVFAIKLERLKQRLSPILCESSIPHTCCAQA